MQVAINATDTLSTSNPSSIPNYLEELRPAAQIMEL
jgi:hypothetical protein